jgi:hypothetical protein
MADGPTLISILAPVIVGGIIGIAGSVVGPLILEWRKEISENRRRQQDHIMELINAIYEHHHWLHTQYRLMAQGHHDKLSVTPFWKIEAIKQLYFPHFGPSIQKLANASRTYERWLLTNSQSILEIHLPDELADERKELHGAYLACSNSLIEELRDYSRREFGQIKK